MLSSDAPEHASEGARAGSVNGLAGTSASMSANAASTTTPLESAPSTPAGSTGAAAAKKKTRRGWKGWAIEIVDEEGNTFIRSPSPEPEPDPNQPRRRRGRPRKNPLPEERALTATATAATAVQAEPEAAAENGVAPVASEAAAVDPPPASRADQGAVEDGSGVDTKVAYDNGPAGDGDIVDDPGSDLSPPPEEASPPPPKLKLQMARLTTGTKHPRDVAATASAPNKRSRLSGATTPLIHAEPRENVGQLSLPDTGPSSSRRVQQPPKPDAPRRRPGRPRKSELSKPIIIDSSDEEDEKQAGRPGEPMDLDLDSGTANTRLLPAARHHATSGSANGSHARETTIASTGCKSGVAQSSRPQQRTLPDFVTPREAPTHSSKAQHADLKSAQGASPPREEAHEPQMRPTRKRESPAVGPCHEPPPTAPRKLLQSSVADEARAIIAASKAKAQSDAREVRDAEERSAETYRDRPENAMPEPVMRYRRESRTPDVQEKQEEPGRCDRQESINIRHQERERELRPGHGQLRSREIQSHELRGSLGSNPRGLNDRDRDRDRDHDHDHDHDHDRERQYHNDGDLGGSMARYDGSPRFDPRVDRDARDRLVPDPRANGHYTNAPPQAGPSVYPQGPPFYGHRQQHGPPPGQYGYQPGFYPAPPLPQAPPHHLPLRHTGYPYGGSSMTSPRDQPRPLYDGFSPHGRQEEWYGHNGHPPVYPTPLRGSTSSVAPPQPSRRTQPAASRSPGIQSPRPHLPPMRASPSDHSTPLQREHGSDARIDGPVDRRDPRAVGGPGYAERDFHERREMVLHERARQRDHGSVDRRLERQLQERQRDGEPLSYTNVVPAPFPTGPLYRAPEPHPPRMDPRYPSLVLAPPGTAVPLPTNRTDLSYAKDHARGLEGLDPSLEDNARGFVENVKNNLRKMVGTYFLEPSASRDAFLERIGRDLAEFGWTLTDASDGALYSRGPAPRSAENGVRVGRNAQREWLPPLGVRQAQDRPRSADGPLRFSGE